MDARWKSLNDTYLTGTNTPHYIYSFDSNLGWSFYLSRAAAAASNTFKRHFV